MGNEEEEMMSVDSEKRGRISQNVAFNIIL